jgi:hypothetical protein
MRWLFMLIAIVNLTTAIDAQTERETMDIAKREVLRRGSHVVATGTVRSGLVEQALAPPADDSDKWHFTLIGEVADKNFQAMKTMLSETKEQSLLAWVDVKDQPHSKMWYHERIWDLKGTQKDWLLPLEGQVKEHGLPLIVIQPCRNGRFGDPTTIVKRIHGVVTASELAEKIRESVFAYVQSIDKPVNTSGVTQTDIGVPPPFNVNPQNTPPVPKPEEKRQTFEFPDLKPAALTLEQLRNGCPGATPEFLLEVISAKESNLEKVQLQWMVAQLKQERSKPSVDLAPVPENEGEVVPARPGAKDRSSFFVPANSSPETLALTMIGVFLAGMVAMRLQMIPWGTLIGGVGGGKNTRGNVDQMISTYHQTMRAEGRNYCQNPMTQTPTESNAEPSESTSTKWRPSNVKGSEPSE